MNKAFAPPSDSRVSFVITGKNAVSSLTGKKYHIGNNSQSRNSAIEKLKSEDTEILKAAEERLTQALQRPPTDKEGIRHIQHGDVLEVDERSLAEKILQDGELRDNAIKDEDDFGGAPIRRAGDLDNEKLWGKSKARREVAEKMKQQADDADAQRASELKAQADREAREANPVWQRAKSHSEIALRLARANPATSETELALLKSRVDGVMNGELSGQSYFDELDRAES